MDERTLFVMSIIQRDIVSIPGMSRLAQMVNVSPSRLRHLFKTDAGVCIRKYKRQLRMERATKLLVTTFLTIKEIRALVGINSDSHFANDFKKAFGVTPTRYRLGIRSIADTDKE